MAHETLADVAVQRLTRWKSTTMSSLLGRYRIADIDVEIIGDIRHRASQERPWDEPVHASIYWMPVACVQQIRDLLECVWPAASPPPSSRSSPTPGSLRCACS